MRCEAYLDKLIGFLPRQFDAGFLAKNSPANVRQARKLNTSTWPTIATLDLCSISSRKISVHESSSAGCCRALVPILSSAKRLCAESGRAESGSRQTVVERSLSSPCGSEPEREKNASDLRARKSLC